MSLKTTTNRIAEGHTSFCNIYPDFQGTCDCGYDQAIVDALDAADRFESWLEEAEKDAMSRMENPEKHDQDRHDYEVMLRTLGMVRRKYEGTS